MEERKREEYILSWELLTVDKKATTTNADNKQ